MKFRTVIKHAMIQHLFETWYASELFEHIDIQIKGIILDGKKIIEVSVNADHPEYIEMLEAQFHRNCMCVGMNWYLNLQRVT